MTIVDTKIKNTCKKGVRERLILKDKYIIQLLRDPELKEYLIMVISAILKQNSQIIGEDFEIIDNRLSTARDTKNSEGDLVIRCKYGLLSLEINYSGPSKITDNKNISYICQLVLKQLPVGDNKYYQKLEKVIQFNMSCYDQFKRGRFIYVSSMLEEDLHIKRSDIIQIIDLNMDFLNDLDYTVVRAMRDNTAEKLLYILTCDKELWAEVYGDDKLMKKVQEKIDKLLNTDLDAYLRYDREKFLKEVEKEVVANEAREDGMEKGRIDARLEAAKKFIDNGSDADYVISTLNLTKEEIKQLNIL